MPHIQIKKMFLVNRRTGQRHRVGGLKKSDYKPKDKSLRKHFTKCIIYDTKELPPKVDLRPWMTPVEDQGRLGSWYVIDSMFEYRVIRKNVTKVQQIITCISLKIFKQSKN